MKASLQYITEIRE